MDTVIKLFMVFIRIILRGYLAKTEKSIDASTQDFNGQSTALIGENDKRLAEKVLNVGKTPSSLLWSQSILQWIWEQNRPFSLQCYYRSLELAVIYPVALALIFWLFSGSNLSTANVTILVGEPSFIKRVFSLSILVSMTFCLLVFCENIGEITTTILSFLSLIILLYVHVSFFPFAGNNILFVLLGIFIFSKDSLAKESTLPYSVFMLILFPIVIVWILNKLSTNTISDPYYHYFLVVFLCVVLPILNAMSDWCSVSVTQYLLSKYKTKHLKNILLLAKDLLFALGCLVMLYAAIVASLYAMQWVGWGIEPKTWLHAMIVGEEGGSRIWFLLLAMTNLIPTFIHLAFWLSLWLPNSWGCKHENMKKLYQQLLNGQPITSKKDARELAKYLHRDGYLEKLIIALAVFACMVFGALVLLDNLLLGILNAFL